MSVARVKEFENFRQGFISVAVIYRGDRGQLTIRVSRIIDIKNKTREKCVNVSKNAAATAAQSTVTSC